jgi:hypothetical protein
MLCIRRLHRWGGLAAKAEVLGVPPSGLRHEATQQR